MTDLKIQQAEETYHQAKQAFDEVTDSLYEELPTLYDRYQWFIYNIIILLITPVLTYSTCTHTLCTMHTFILYSRTSLYYGHLWEG